MAKAISILVVDDSPLIRKKLYADLTERGAKVLLAGSVVDAKKQVLDAAEIGVFLIDYNLPGANGLDFLAWLREREAYAETPAMLLTTQCRSDDASSDALGISAWLVKPVSIENLWLVIEAVTAGKKPGEAAIL